MPVVMKMHNTSLFRAPGRGYSSPGWSSSGEHVLITLKVFTVRHLCSLHLVWTWHVLPSFSGLAPYFCVGGSWGFVFEGSVWGRQVPFQNVFRDHTPLLVSPSMCRFTSLFLTMTYLSISSTHDFSVSFPPFTILFLNKS